jgi:DNA-binding protein HU-beta
LLYLLKTDAFDASRLHFNVSYLRHLSLNNRPYSAVASINKKAFVDAVAEAAGVEKKVAENVVNAALGVVTASVAAGEKITLTGFGTFERKMRAAREGRNPKTGEALKIPASAYPSFSAGKSFKDAVKK